jgi:putative transposase
MSRPSKQYRRHRFPPQITSHAVWLYHRFFLSFRDVEDLLAQRGVEVSYETVRRWCLKFGPGYAARAKRRQPRLGDTWYPIVTPRVAKVATGSEDFAVCDPPCDARNVTYHAAFRTRDND